MFWKKKKSNEDENQEGGKLFKVPDSDQRSAFRVSPNPLDPIIVKIADKKIKVLEISSGGISLVISWPDLSDSNKAGSIWITYSKSPALVGCQP